MSKPTPEVKLEVTRRQLDEAELVVIRIEQELAEAKATRDFWRAELHKQIAKETTS